MCIIYCIVMKKKTVYIHYSFVKLYELCKNIDLLIKKRYNIPDCEIMSNGKIIAKK